MANELQTSKADDTAIAPELDAFLRADNIVKAINANLPSGIPQLPPIPKDYVFRKRDRETVSVAMHAAFELIGGLPAFMQWGAHNPDKFYGLYSKLLQSDTETPVGGTLIQFVSAIPANQLDRVTVDETGRVVTIEHSDDGLPE